MDWEEGDKHKPIWFDHNGIHQEDQLEELGTLIPWNEEIQLSGEVEYLGEILDPRLNWNEHLGRKQMKLEEVALTEKCGAETNPDVLAIPSVG